MKYSIQKDAKPEDTVNKIKKILSDLEIEIKENWLLREDSSKNATSSVRICAFGKDAIATNGKGTNKINCQASGYAEFIERLQNQIIPYLFVLPQGQYKVAPDEIISNINLIKNDVITKDFGSWNDIRTFNISLNKEKIYNKLNNDEVILVPYFNLSTKSKAYLPIELIRFVKGSNGMASGNTMTEALVQGLSEVCERFSSRKIILEKLALPEIPKDTYLKYDRIKEMIEYCNSNNYKVYIKDASLGLGLPVICTIFEQTNKNLLTMQFGSHPSLPIAIERTFTEFMQGRDISSLNCLAPNYVTEEYFENIKDDLHFISERNFVVSAVFKNNNYFKEQFFKKKSLYSFSKYSWIDESSANDNRSMLEFIIKRITNIYPDIFIRDVSFLGFPSIDIYIPEMTNIHKCDDKYIKKYDSYVNWKMAEENELSIYNEESLLEAFDFALRKNKEIINNPLFIMLITSILTNDYLKIEKVVNMILCESAGMYSVPDKFIIFSKIAKDYFYMKKQNYSSNDIKMKLIQNYKEEDICYFYKVINNLSFDKIKKLVFKYRCKSLFELNNEQKNKINKVRANLYKAYKENIPNQMDLKKIFDFI